MNAVAWVAAGGAIGAVSRYGFNAIVTKALGDSFPWGILLANILGCFLMGVTSAYLMVKLPNNDEARLFLTTGILGGFTTFSAFAFDTLKLVQSGENATAIAYVLVSLMASLAAVFLGFALSRAFT